MRRLLLVVMLAGCGAGDHELRVQLEVPTLDEAVSSVSVWLVDECPPEAERHLPPVEPIESSVVRGGQAAVVWAGVREGRYGVHALARDDSCAVLAVGCEAVRVGSDDGGSILVVLAPTSAVQGCDAEQVCDGGMCWAEGSCAPIGAGCGLTLPCCTGTCSPETVACAPVPEL